MDKKTLLEQFKFLFDVMSDNDFVDSVANFCWNLFIKLKEKGFSEEQAMQIVSAMAKSNNK